MKKFFSSLLCGLLAALAVFGFAACEQKETDDRAVLKVGMECAYQPYNWTQFDKSNGAVAIKGKKGEYANGFDVKVAQAIADALDMRLEVHKYEWESLISGVQSGALDLIIAGMSPTAERKEKVDFSSPYYTSNLVIVVRKDGAYKDAKTIQDFSGAELVAQEGTFHDEVIDQIQGVKHGTPREDFSEMIIALKANSIDGYVAEVPGATADCNANSEFMYIPLVNNETGFTIEDLSNVTLAVGVKKGSDMLARVNGVIDAMAQDELNNLMTEAVAQAPKGL